MWTANKKSLEIKEQLSLDILFHENVDSQMANDGKTTEING